MLPVKFCRPALFVSVYHFTLCLLHTGPWSATLRRSWEWAPGHKPSGLWHRLCRSSSLLSLFTSSDRSFQLRVTHRLSFFRPLLLLQLLSWCEDVYVPWAVIPSTALLRRKIIVANKVLTAFLMFIFICMTSQTSLAAPNDEITTCSEILNHFLNIWI